ncbi:MAG: hypothetical protein JW723_07310 [Bacteroidales bacterium]|nr:hypothetical protein [Bacteroidales bacterium]
MKKNPGKKKCLKTLNYQSPVFAAYFIIFVFLLSDIRCNAQCPDIIPASKLESQRMSVVKEFAKIYVRYGTGVKFYGCEKYIPSAHEINLIKPGKYRLICDDNSVFETEFTAGKTYVIGKLIYDFRFTWKTDNNLHIRSSQYGHLKASGDYIKTNIDGTAFEYIYVCGSYGPFLYSEKEEATRELYSEKIMEGSVKYATDILTNRAIKKRKYQPTSLLVHFKGKQAEELANLVFIGRDKAGETEKTGEAIFKYFVHIVPDIYINDKNCPQCADNIKRALNATSQTCIIESSQTEVEKIIKENEQFHEIRNVTVPALIAGMGVTLLIIFLLI